jgi:diguanylate cyclase (GGDEF)-like protein
VFSPSNNNDLFTKYKQQTYRLAFPFGVIITAFYVVVLADAASLQFYLGIGMAIVLFILSVLVWRENRFLNVIELIFYFMAVSLFFVLTYLSIETLIGRNNLSPETLSDNLNSLGMWLIVFMLGGFLTLKNTHARLLLIYIFSGMALLGVVNILFLVSSNQLNASFLFRWVNPLAALLIAILLIQRMGVLQQNQASTDALTGLLNRRALYRILEREMERSNRYKKVFSLILFDLDNFKQINDTHGHLSGDHALRGVSDLVRKSIRQTDSMGRWGGEEFLLILPETDAEAAGMFAERMRKLMAEYQFGKVENVTASFGVTSYRVEQTLEEMLHAADHAMYQAKRNGRNQVAVDASAIPLQADK